MDSKEQKKIKLRSISNRIVSISILIILISMILLVYNQIKLNEELKQKNIDLNNKNFKLESLNQTLADLLSEQKTKNQLIDIISAYADAINRRDLEKSLSFYADSVHQFFLRESVDKEFIRKELVNFFGDNSRLRVLFNSNRIAINIESGDMIARIEKEYYAKAGTKKTVITEMRFDRNYKITYIRDFYAESD